MKRCFRATISVCTPLSESFGLELFSVSNYSQARTILSLELFSVANYSQFRTNFSRDASRRDAMRHDDATSNRTVLRHDCAFNAAAINHSRIPKFGTNEESLPASLSWTERDTINECTIHFDLTP